MRYPLKDIYITQYFGENPDIYKRFGLKGHNGVDFRAPDGTPVYAPHDGVVKERNFDTDGYGKYVKIESSKEGSVLAHFKDWAVNINKNVREGDLVGYADNTGFSTGSHLHWGYYRIPRDRGNGYGGFIDQLPILEAENMNMQNWLRTMFLELGIDLLKPESEIRGRVQEIIDGYRQNGENKKKIEALEKELAGATGEAAENETRLQICERSREEANKEVEEAQRIVHNREKEIELLNRRLSQYDGKVVLLQEEYDRLISYKVIDRFKSTELITEIVKRIFRRG